MIRPVEQVPSVDAHANRSVMPTVLAVPFAALTLVSASGVGSQPVVRESHVSGGHVRTITDWYPDLVAGMSVAGPAPDAGPPFGAGPSIDDLLDRYRGALEPGSFTPADIDSMRREWA